MAIPKLSLSVKEIEAGAGLIKQYSVAETYPVHTHDFYEIVFITGGKGTHCINGEQQILSEGSLVFIRPSDVHSFKALNYFDFEMFSMGFMEEELQNALNYLEVSKEVLTEPGLPVHLKLEGNGKVFFEQQLERMLWEQETELRKQIFRTVLQQALYNLITWDSKECDREVLPAWLSKLDEEMSKRENYIEGLPKMLRLCNYSQEYMTRMFKKYFKMTPTEYINAKRMIYAAELLTEGQNEIVEICDMAGFNNLSYFYTVFKKQYGCTPYRFLKSFSGKREEDEGVFL